MGKPHWYIKTFFGDKVIRREGFSTKVQCMDGIYKYLKSNPEMDNFAPNNKLSTSDDVYAFVISSSSTHCCRRVHAVFTNEIVDGELTLTIYVPVNKSPAHFTTDLDALIKHMQYHACEKYQYINGSGTQWRRLT